MYVTQLLKEGSSPPVERSQASSKRVQHNRERKWERMRGGEDVIYKENDNGNVPNVGICK